MRDFCGCRFLVRHEASGCLAGRCWRLSLFCFSSIQPRSYEFWMSSLESAFLRFEVEDGNRCRFEAYLGSLDGLFQKEILPDLFDKLLLYLFARKGQFAVREHPKG